MKVEVRLFANLRDRLPRESKGGVTHVDLPEGANGSDLVSQLAIPRNQPLIFMINGRRQPEDHPLREGDRVGIFPPVGGG